MMRFYFTMSHVPGRQLTIADTLSQAPTDSPNVDNHEFNQESQTQYYTEYICCSAMSSTNQRITEKGHSL